MISTIKPLV